MRLRDRDVTADARDLTFRWTDPGGYASCVVPLDRPLTMQPDEIAYYSPMTIYDRQSGAVVWDGRQEDPGRSARDGQVWELAGVGGQAHTRDRSFPIIYADRSIESSAWAPADIQPGQAKGGSQVGSPDATDARVAALRLYWDSGLAVKTNDRVATQYVRLRDTGQWVARVGADHREGVPSTQLQVQYVSRHGSFPGTDAALESDNWTTSTASILQQIGVGGMDKHAAPELRLYNPGGTATSGDTYWTEFSNVYVIGSRYLKGGTEKLSGYASTVLASDVVEDLLGRVLTQFDGANAIVTPTSLAIDQLAYPDGVTPDRILSDLLALEGGFTWRVWERGSTGKFRFEFVPVPSQVRYEADVVDGYDSQGSGDGLYNRVTVRWRDSSGKYRTIVRTATVPALDAVSLIRQGQLDLGDEVGSLSAAQAAGDRWLAERQYPANGGRLRIARPILDLLSGRMVMPWEVRPGLIRVRGILPRPDALNGVSRDGVTIFRIVSSEYRASDGSATLELDSYARTTPRMIADLVRQRVPIRRR
ncbi:hypothetical protein A6A27_10720 [Micromonospora sp. CB01531]|nr:hypothetical protein A6A27_10720 [Micromonospora sp. CB01531]